MKCWYISQTGKKPSTNPAELQAEFSARKVLACLRICLGSPEPSILDNEARCD